MAKQHFAVDVVADGEAGWRYGSTFAYDSIVLDVMLPKLDGITLCKQLRDRGLFVL
ncbi:MAG: response regulator [Hydrococcus sp. Prado102]|nr:response regulator [Hydrococcus sp. Prado102]